MGLIPQTKCARCDRTYSGLRSRCPYCGAHRNKRGKRVSDGDNATWKLIIGILLIVVLITAVVVILVTGSNEKQPPDGGPSGSGTPSIDHEQGKNPTGDPTGPDDTGTKISVTTADGSAVTNLTLKVNGTADLTAVITPETTDVPVWTSSDTAVLTLEDNGITGLSYHLVAVAKGTATVTVTVGEAKYEFTVTVEEDTTASPTATGVIVRTQYGTVLNDITLKLGEQLDLTVELTPSTCKSTPEWTSSNEPAVQIVYLDETGMRIRLTGMGDFGPPSTLTCTVDGIEFTIVVHTNNIPFDS